MHKFSVILSAHFSRATWLLSLHPSVYLLFSPLSSVGHRFVKGIYEHSLAAYFILFNEEEMDVELLKVNWIKLFY